MPVATSEVSERVQEILGPWEGKKGGLIPILQEIQHEFGYLREDVLEEVSRKLTMPLAEIYGVATFYAQFHLKPRGRNIIRVCRGTACHVRGSLAVLNKVKDLLKIGEGETTDDLRFTLEPVACLGACGLAPVVMVNDQTFGRLTPDGVQPVLDKFE